MRAVVLKGFGDESVLSIGDVPPPKLEPDDIRISVNATAVNRADLLQREGHYPPPPGASDILGLECAGVVVEVGTNVTGWRTGERAMALLPGGGYAEQVVVNAGSAMHVPDALTDQEAGAMPEAFLTAFLNIFILGTAKRCVDHRQHQVHIELLELGQSGVRIRRKRESHQCPQYKEPQGQCNGRETEPRA